MPSRPGAGALGAWIAVHQSGPAAVLIGTAAGASWLLGGTRLATLGAIRLAVPISVLLLVPVLAGVGVAVATLRPVAPPLPEPLRAAGARLAWFTCVLALASAAVSAGLVADRPPDGPGLAAVVRNVALHAALATITSRIDQRALWLPGVVLSLAAMLFGQSTVDGSHAGWAFVLAPAVSTTGAMVTVTLVALAVVIIAVPAEERLMPGPTPTVRTT